MAKKTQKTYIHVNQHVIRSNKKHDENKPVITIKKGSKKPTKSSIKLFCLNSKLTPKP